MPGPQDARGLLGDRVFTVPNALSLSRRFMVPVVVVLLLARADALAAAFFVLAAATDFLDGRLARRAGPTRLGQILDPLADRLMLSSVAVVLAIRGLLPVWAVAVLMGSVALVVIIQGAMLGEIMFYAGFGLSIAAGLMYASKVRRILGGGEAG